MGEKPYVILNVAMTVDGKIDTYERHGARISSTRDLERVDRLRASVDGVIVGGHTLHDEDPRLTVRSEALIAERIARGQSAQPARIGIASRLSLRPDARFLNPSARVLVFVPHGCAPNPTNGLEVLEVGDGRVDLMGVMSALTRMGMQRVLVEGGGTLNFSLFNLGLVDELQAYVAPIVFGGATAPTLADGGGVSREQALRLGPPQVEVWPDGGVLLRYMVERS